MKKFLSILLAVAMIVSVVSVVSFAADDYKQIIKYDFEDEKAPDGFQGSTAKVSYETEKNHGKVLKFTTEKAWESPYFELGAAIKKAMTDNGMSACTVKVSFDAKTVDSDGKGRCVIRGVNNRKTDDVSDAAGNLLIYAEFEGNKSATAFYDEWETYEFEFFMNAADLETIGTDGGDTYRVMFDQLDGSEMGMYIDNFTVSVKDEKASEVKTPTGVKFTLKEDLELGSNEALFICSPSNIVSEKDVKDGKLTKTLLIKNNGKEDITVEFKMQAKVKKADGSDTWAGNPDSVEPVVVAAGKTASVTYTADVADGAVTILDQKVALKDLFLRFNVYHLDGDFSLSEGASFTVVCDADTAKTLSKLNTMASKDKITVELSYGDNGKSNGTGDALPVALVACAVASAVALVVVSKKKKNEI